MNKLDGKDFYNYSNQFPNVEEKINQKLPIEVFEYILSHCSIPSLSKATPVSRSWNLASINAVKHRVLNKVNSLLFFLGENNKSQDQQILKKISNSKNLKEIKSSFEDAKYEFGKILWNLKDEDWKSLVKKRLDSENVDIILEIAEHLHGGILFNLIKVFLKNGYFEETKELEYEMCGFKSPGLNELLSFVENLRCLNVELKLLKEKSAISKAKADACKDKIEKFVDKFCEDCS